MKRSVQHLQSINIQDEYGTPKYLLVETENRYNIFPDLDVCCTKKNHKYPYYNNIEKFNSLDEIWNIPFFMNPPYSEIYQWMKKAYHEHLKNNVDALILVYSKTDTKWWHEFVEGIAEVHFIKGRLKFLDSNGVQTKNSAPYPSCWIIYRKK